MGIVSKTLQENYVYFLRELARIDRELAALPKGGISAKRIGGATYYYRQWREGDKVRSVSLGRSVPRDVSEAAARRRRLEEQRREVLENLSDIGRAVDTQRVTADEIVRLLSARGVRLVLAGSYCIPVLRESLDMSLPTIRTQDIDFMVESPYRGVPVDVDEVLGGIGFSIGFNADGSTYFTNGVFKVEFLTPEKGRGTHKAVPIHRLKIRAQPLRYLGMLRDEAMEFTKEGYTVTVPNPWVLAFHKLLIARDRRPAGKRDKDLQQAAALLREVLKNPAFVAKARAYLEKMPAKWRARVKAEIKTLVPEWESGAR